MIACPGMFYGCYGKYSVLILNRRFVGRVFSFASYIIVSRPRRASFRCGCALLCPPVHAVFFQRLGNIRV